MFTPLGKKIMLSGTRRKKKKPQKGFLPYILGRIKPQKKVTPDLVLQYFLSGHSISSMGVDEYNEFCKGMYITTREIERMLRKAIKDETLH